MLVTNPIPEEYAMDHEVINRAIDEAVAQANAQGIHGKATTPFLLARLKELTGGDSLDSNIQLVFNNARLAAQSRRRAVQAGLSPQFPRSPVRPKRTGDFFRFWRRNISFS